MKRVIIIGGGLGGLIAAIQLVKAGISCTVIEKKAYPFHRVCGEYISNEVVPFLKSIDLFPAIFRPPEINRFMLSSVIGKFEVMPLDLGGFGISRFTFDNFLYEHAKSLGVEFRLREEVNSIDFSNDLFEVKTQANAYNATIVIGAFGKRSKVDRKLNRSFLQKRSPYLGVKYHIRTNHPNDLIALHNFPGGYCGMSNIEDGKTTLCYLTHRSNLSQFGEIRAMEEKILFKNPLLRTVFTESEFLFDKPEVINEISFETKTPLQDHILMCGDAAGMIAPLCGNGMAMAIRSGKILADLVIRYATEKYLTREMLEKSYVTLWRQNFSRQLWRGRQIQRLFGNTFASKVAVNLAIYVKPISKGIIKSTHGDPF